MGPMMFFSAIMKLKQNPGAVHTIHEVVGVPLSLFPLLAVCEIFPPQEALVCWQVSSHRKLAELGRRRAGD